MNSVETVLIHDLSRGGSGVGKLATGEVVFVPYTAPGDTVEIQIVKKEKTYREGRILKIVNPSPDRVTPLCPVFTTCGGCSWQHIPYEKQFEIKKKGILHVLKRAGIETSSIPFEDYPAVDHYFYRNRIQLRGSVEKQKLGFYSKNSHQTVLIDDCKIADSRINDSFQKIITDAKSRMKEDYKVEIELSDNQKIQFAFNQGHSAFGFRQINDKQNDVLRNFVKNSIVPAETLFDLYGGSGNLSLDLKKSFTKIYCIDTNAPEDQSDSQYSFVKQSISAWAKKDEPGQLYAKSTSFILDPPREGLSADFINLEKKLSKFNIASIVLISCDVDSFSKDVLKLTQKGFQLKKLAAVDLFPQTPHIESLALFTK